MILYCCEETGVNFKYEELTLKKYHFFLIFRVVIRTFFPHPSVGLAFFFFLLLNTLKIQNYKRALDLSNPKIKINYIHKKFC